MSPEVQKEGKSRPAAKVDFKNASKLALSDTVRLVTANDVVLTVKGKDRAFKSVKWGLEHLEENDTEFLVETVYVKKLHQR